MLRNASHIRDLQLLFNTHPTASQMGLEVVAAASSQYQ